MSSVHSKYLEVYNAKQFKESVSEPSSSNVYLTFGKVTSWPDDNNPPTPNTSTATFNEVWKNMIAGKRLTGNDIRHVVPRHDWTSNTVYTAYDHMTDSLTLKDANTKFYVLTDEFNVYKCLGNNYGHASTVKPTSKLTTSHFQTTDLYIWKYMYTLTVEERSRYLSPDFMPVKTLTLDDNSTQWLVQNDASPGAIHNIVVTNGGSGYTSNDISVIIVGDGIDANAYAIRNVTTNTISSIVVDSKGASYTYADVTVYANTESNNAVVRAIIAPPGGHGSDSLTELGGSYLMLNPKFQGVETGKLTAANDYRQVAFIEDPYIYGTSTIIGNTIVSQTTNFTLNGTSSEYLEDEIVYQGDSLANATFTGIVVEWDSPNNYIKLSNVEGDPGSELLIGNTSTAARFLSSVTDPDMQPYTGKLLYIDNITPIERAEDQTETFQIVLKF